MSSFGISGTNAHLILEQAPDQPESPPTTVDTPTPWLLSARTQDALRAQAARLHAHVQAHPEHAPHDIAHALATTRAHHTHRAAVVGTDTAELLEALRALAEGDTASGASVVTGSAAHAAKPVFVFPGQGAQWVAMADGLLDDSRAFRECVEACEAAFAPYLDWSVLSVLRQEAEAPSLDRVDVVQPVLFTMMVSLAAAWRDLGVEPAAVVGHSQGEIAAAHIAGGLSLDDAARVVALRSQAWLELSGQGGMAAVALNAEELRLRLERWGDRLSVAAVNSPGTASVAGYPDALAELIDELRADGIDARSIPGVDTAGHSAQVDVFHDHLLKVLAPVSPRSSAVPFYSTVTGGPLDTAELGAPYWYRNMREPVRFEAASRALLADGHTLFVELSTHPLLGSSLQETIADAGRDAAVLHTLRRDHGGVRRLLTAVAHAHTHGASVDWAGVFAGTEARPVALPTYAFQRRPYWLEAPAVADVTAAGLAGAEHPLLSATVELPDADGLVFTGLLSTQSHPWLAEHTVRDTVLLPGTGFLDLLLHAGAQAGCDRIDDLTLQAPLVLPAKGAVQIQISVGAADERGRRSCAVHSRPEGGEPGSPWTCHGTGLLAAEDAPVTAAASSSAWPPEGAVAVDTEDVYERLTEFGLGYGTTFRGLRAAWRDGDALCAEVSLPEGTDTDGFSVHPALLDAALHTIALLDAGSDGGPLSGPIRLPFAWTGVTLHAVGASRLRVRLTPTGQDSVTLTVSDPSGGAVATVESLTLRAVDEDELAAGAADLHHSLFHVGWSAVPAPLPEPAGPPAAVIGDGSPSAYADLAALVEAVDAGAPVPETLVVVCSGGDGSAEDADPVARTQELTREILDVVRPWLADERFSSTHLLVATRRAVAIHAGEGVLDIAASAVRGFVRVAQSENPDRITLVDLDDDTAVSADLVSVVRGAREPELALRAGVCHVPRLAHAYAAPPLRIPDRHDWRLEASGRATLETLAVIDNPVARQPLADGEVRISVRAAGVNFRDVLVALAMVPGQETIGSEAAGVVTEVGPGVTGVVVGDRVMGLFEGSLSPVAVTDHRLVVPVPAGWSDAQAASAPVAFLTAYYGLKELVGLRPGQRVLVHAATGGVGLAALQLAGHLGAEVFTTASPAKQHVLRARGFDDDHIANSRTLDFEKQFLSVTGGLGVDVVLNSLAQEFVDASLRLVAPGGHFLEMGKTDIRDAVAVGETHPGVRYQAYNLDQEGPDCVRRMLGELAELFERGVLEPLPTTSWDMRHAPEAFRHLSQARHIGKVALTVPRSLDPEGTVLITGGTGTLGSLIARHLVTH
ncbi:acyltransferase domain-containing protein, partial [Streptomyces sp. NPDC001920]